MEGQGNRSRDKTGKRLKLQTAQLILLIYVGKGFIRKYWVTHKIPGVAENPGPENLQEHSVIS